MIYELRRCRCLPGKLPALLKRFEASTIELWGRHGIQQVGFWTTLVGPSDQELIFMIAWESFEERERKWTAFATDPDWLAVRADSQQDGEIIASVENSLLTPTKFSAVR